MEQFIVLLVNLDTHLIEDAVEFGGLEEAEEYCHNVNHYSDHHPHLLVHNTEFTPEIDPDAFLDLALEDIV